MIEIAKQQERAILVGVELQETENLTCPWRNLLVLPKQQEQRL